MNTDRFSPESFEDYMARGRSVQEIDRARKPSSVAYLDRYQSPEYQQKLAKAVAEMRAKR